MRIFQAGIKLSVITITTMICISVSGQNTSVNYKNYRIKLGVKWYNGDDTITRAELKSNIPCEFRKKTDTTQGTKIKNYKWEIIFIEKGKNSKELRYSYSHSDNNNVMINEVDKMKGGDITLFKDINVINSDSAVFYPKTFKLYVQ